MKSLRLLRITAWTFLLLSLQGLTVAESYEAAQLAGSIGISSSAAVAVGLDDTGDKQESSADFHFGCQQCHFGHCPLVLLDSSYRPITSSQTCLISVPGLSLSSSLRDLFRPPLTV